MKELLKNPITMRFLKALVFGVSAVIGDQAIRADTRRDSVWHLVLLFATLSFGIAAGLQFRMGFNEWRSRRKQAASKPQEHA